MTNLGAAERAVLASGLSTADAPADASIADRLLAALPWAAEHRLTGLLWQVAADAGPVPDEIAHATDIARRRCRIVEDAAVRALTALRSAGIDALTWKGIATAHADYPDPGTRIFYDADLLVRRADLAPAIAVLADAGYRHEPSPLGPEWEARFARATLLADPTHAEIDLHAAIAAGGFGIRFGHDGLFARAERFQLDDHDVWRPSAPDRLVTTAYALALSRGGSLRLARDLAQLLLVTGVRPDDNAVGGPDAEIVVAEAIRTTAEVIDLPATITEWAAERPPSRRQRRELGWAQSPGWRGDALSELGALGWRDKVPYAVPVIRREISRRRG